MRTSLSIALLALCAGCGTPAVLDNLPPTYFSEGNRMTFEHAFTDSAAEAVRRRADAHCAHTRQVGVKTGGTCSLTRCTTHYQCMDQAAAATYRPVDAKK